MKTKILPLLLALAILLSACHLPVEQVKKGNEAEVWLDAPLDGSHLPREPYELVMHATGAAGNIASFEVKVNGNVESVVDAEKVSTGTLFYMAKYWWLPPDNGEYTIEVSARNKTGSNSVPAQAHVTVGEQYKIQAYTPFDPQSEAGDDPDVDEQPTNNPPTAEAPVCFHKVEWQNQGQPEVYTAYGNAVFTVNWLLKNVGNCPWDENFKVVRVDSPDNSNDFVQKEFPIGKKIEVGQVLDFRIQVTAPANGFGRLNWMLYDGSDTFGTGQEASAAFWFEYEVQGKAGDNEPPQFTAASISPQNPTAGQDVTAYVETKDNVGVVQIKMVFTQGANVQERSCFNKAACTVILGGWAAGNVSIDAFAYDAAGNVGQLGARTLAVAAQRVATPVPPPATPVPPPATPARDTIPPTISYKSSPKNPNQEQQVTISVSATDNDKVASIVIVLTPQDGSAPRKQTCLSANSCVFKDYLNHGEWVVNITVKDPSGNTASVIPFIIKVTAVLR